MWTELWVWPVQPVAPMDNLTLKPMSHLHTKEPCVFWHTPFKHKFLFSRHSSTSEIITTIKHLKNDHIEKKKRKKENTQSLLILLFWYWRCCQVGVFCAQKIIFAVTPPAPPWNPPNPCTSEETTIQLCHKYTAFPPQFLQKLFMFDHNTEDSAIDSAFS